ncbi:hotdog family protein [Paraburkholderia denitrificans]|uniref:Hotdog family protein n=1 Tax=Paraburkholderia denitrificans TaxID=694025 RepID=A0ABW0JBX4_9BURK
MNSPDTPLTTPPTPLGRDWIAAHIPHAGSMCLLDEVVTFDDERIRCTATSHLDAANPLRANGRLAAVCGIEYAAQAMAVHGAVVGAAPGAMPGSARERPRVGYLASVRSVEAYVERLDDLDAPLTIEAERVSGDTRTILYRFAIHCGARLILAGRAAVMLDANANPKGSTA